MALGCKDIMLIKELKKNENLERLNIQPELHQIKSMGYEKNIIIISKLLLQIYFVHKGKMVEYDKTKTRIKYNI